MCRTVLCLMLVGVALAVCAPPASATSPCPDWPFTSPNKSVYKKVTVKSVVGGSDQAKYKGIIVRPRKTPKGKKIPGVVVLHGRGGNRCGLWWAARLLASHHYIALVVSMDPGVDVAHASDIADVAARSSVSFLRSHKDPYRRYLNRGDLGIVGHSQGSMGASRAQSDLPHVKAIVGMDNLRAFGYDDPGGIGCAIAGTQPVTPKVPGLGIGSETGCGPRTDKLAGYHAWRALTAAGTPVPGRAPLPTMEVVLAHSDHGSFGGGGPHTVKHRSQLKASGYYMRAWFDRWLKHNHGAQARLLDPTPMGTAIDDLLSAKSPMGPMLNPAAFHSAAYLPGLIDCEDLRSCL
jgi:hypothetical protein